MTMMFSCWKLLIKNEINVKQVNESGEQRIKEYLTKTFKKSVFIAKNMFMPFIYIQ